MNELCEGTKWNRMLLLYLGSIIIIQTYCKPVNKHEYHPKRNITTDDKGFKRQFDIQCSDTRCCWVHGRGHDTHDHHCGLNLHPVRTHSYHQCRENNGYNGNACGMNVRNCGQCRCNAHSHHGYNNCGRCYCGYHALHNNVAPCNCDFDSHSNHDYIGAGAIHHLECNSEDDDHPCSHISHAGYAHHRQPIIHHVNHYPMSVPRRSTCRVWKENDCVEFLKEFVESSPLPFQTHIVEPVHLYGTVNEDGISHRVPSAAMTSNSTLDAAPVPAAPVPAAPVPAATVPSNPTPQPAANNIYFHQIPIPSSHTPVYPLPAREEPTDVEIEPLDTDINPNGVANTNNQPIAAGNKLVTHSNISTIQSLEAPSTASDTDDDPTQDPGVTANVPLQVNVDNTEFTNGGTVPTRTDARLTLDSPVLAGGDAVREVQNINSEAESTEITPAQTTAHPEPVIKLAHGTVTDDLQTNASVDNAEDNAVAGENIVPAQTVRKPVYAKVSSTRQGNVVSTDEDTANINVVRRPVLTKVVPSVRAGNAVSNTDVRRPIVQREPVISDAEVSLHEDAETNEDDVAHAHDDQKFVYANDTTPTTGDEYATSAETNLAPVKTTNTGNHSIKSPVVGDNESNENNVYAAEDAASNVPTDTDVTPDLSKAEETTQVTNLADREPVTTNRLTSSANRVTNIASQEVPLANRDTAIAGRLNNRAPQVSKIRYRPAQTTAQHNNRKVVLIRKLPRRESVNQLAVH